MTRLDLILCCGMLAAAWALAFDTGLAQTPLKQHKREMQSVQVPTGTPSRTVLNINNISIWVGADGRNNAPSFNSAAYFPRGTASVIYQDGIMWGGRAFSDEAGTIPAPFGQPIRVGGAFYFTGTVVGRIIGLGAAAVPADPAAPDARIYRIRRDYFTMSADELRQDAAEINEISINAVTAAQMQAVLEQYGRDWSEWPVQFGAPYIDRNRNGLYDPPPPFSSSFTVDDLIRGNFDEAGLAGANPNFPAD